MPTSTEAIFGPIVKRTFQTGTLKWLGLDLIKDTRNHQVYPNKGYKITLATKVAPPTINRQFSLLKAELEMSHYTALIGEDWLVLALHAKGGRISSLSDNTIIPYKELFHMGGQSTVRGFTWGGVGPAWKRTGDPLGGRNAVLFNTELIFPLIPDYSMKGHVFYDAGAGWDTPKSDLSDAQKALIMRDKFTLRHSVGLGLNLVKPMPAKIDWGFKLDRKPGETGQEFHLSMNYAF
jgi:outer membrane protein insertion porin family